MFNNKSSNSVGLKFTLPSPPEMKRLTVVLTLIFANFYFAAKIRDEEVQQIYIKSVQCLNLSLEYVFPNYSCYAKSFSRYNSTTTMMLTARKPLRNIFVSFLKMSTLH